MLFHSLDYVAFVAIAFAGYRALRRYRLGRLGWLLVLSCLFYMSWHPAYIALIAASTSVDYVAARRLAVEERPAVRRLLLALSVTLNLGVLGVFKYFDFGAGVAVDVAQALGADWVAPRLGWALPVGISFYTFEAIAYVVDCYYRRIPPARSALEYGSFIMFFPHLVAGPIIRAGDFLGQLERPHPLDAERVGRASFLIATGLVKKVCVADYLAVNLVDRVFDQPELYTAPEVVAGLYAFTMQLYCDFSGYTDIARGTAILFGIDLPENFDRPYLAENPADFWRRWHMTLSTWLRDYLYYPLGGSRLGEARTYANLFITIFLIGVWHGASWNFVFYGAIQASAVVLHRVWRTRVARAGAAEDRGPKSLPVRALHVALCLQLVVFSRILFRAEDLPGAGAVVERLTSGTVSVAQLSPGVLALLAGAFAAHFAPRAWFARLQETFLGARPVLQGASVAVALAACGWMATSDVVPYIYFQF